MANTPLFARGSSLQMKVSGAFAAVTQLTNLDGPKIAGKPVSVTNHGSPGNSEEYLGTTVDVTWSGTINFDPSDPVHIAIRAASLSQVIQNFQYTKAGETTTPGTFNGYIKSWNESDDPTKQRVATFDIVASATFTAAVH